MRTSRRIIIFLFSGVLLFLGAPVFCQAEEITDLQKQIDARRVQIDEMQKQIDSLRKAMQIKQAEKNSLANQLGIINNRLKKTQLDVSATKTRLQETELRQQQTALKIADKEALIAREQTHIGELMRALDFSENQSLVSILASGRTLSDFFTTQAAYNSVSDQLTAALLQILAAKKELDTYQADLLKQENELAELQNTLLGRQGALQSQSAAKAQLLLQTKQSEAKYQQMITDLKRQYAAIEGEISGIERQIQAKLKSGALKLPTGDVALRWPTLSHVVTAYFHDPDYPFRNIFEHPAVDLRSAQGTPVRAAAAGIVARAKNGGKGYSYVIIVHNNRLSTLYGHLSRIDVKEDEAVTGGEVIGLSGGTPGTSGAGPFVTGPHLHFEVRLDGIPVNPLDYLP